MLKKILFYTVGNFLTIILTSFVAYLQADNVWFLASIITSGFITGLVFRNYTGKKVFIALNLSILVILLTITYFLEIFTAAYPANDILDLCGAKERILHPFILYISIWFGLTVPGGNEVNSKK